MGGEYIWAALRRRHKIALFYPPIFGLRRAASGFEAGDGIPSLGERYGVAAHLHRTAKRDHHFTHQYHTKGLPPSSSTGKKMKPLILHGHHTGPNPYKINLVLENLQLPYSETLWVVFGGGGDNNDSSKSVKSPAFLQQINENGRVPALEDPNTGVVAWESHAVINYLLRVYDTSHTLSPGPAASEQDRVDYDKWTAFLITTFGPMMGQRNWYVHFNATDNPDAKTRYREQCMRCFEVLEGQLAKSGGKSILPWGFSAVDCHFWPWMRQVDYAQLDVEEYKYFLKWFRGVGEREEVKRIDELLIEEKEKQGIMGM
ncbi:MAG: hypothetical protein Q9168_003454 [Polycauliona sp. 1 TL-2023]